MQSKIGRRIVRAACVVGLVGSVVMGIAQESALAKRVDLYIKDADLLTATSMLTAQTGIQFVVEPSEAGYERINLALRDMPAEEAIRYLCLAAGAFAEQDENGVFIIRPGRPSAEPETTPTIPIERPIIVRRIQLMKADPQFVLQTLLGNGSQELYEVSQQEFNNFFRANLPGYDGAIAQVTTATGNGYMQQNFEPIRGSNLTNVAPGTAANSVILPGESSNQIGGGGGPGQGGQGQGGQGGQGQGGQGQQGGGLPQPGQGFVPDGITNISYDPMTNSLIVQGSEEAIRELERLIEMFDVAPQQVSIKVEFITTSNSLDESLGIDWLYQRGTISAGNRPGTFARTSDPVFINYATGNLVTRLRAILSNGWGRVVNAPMVRTLNNQTATVFQTASITVFINQVTNGPGGIIITSVPVQIPVSTFLTIRPRINGDGTITMALFPQITSVGQFRRGPDGQEVPDILSQGIQVVARVKNGETVALAGFTAKQENFSQSRIPLLSDIPIIGQLFRGRNEQVNNSELIVFVTPHILDADDSGLGP